ncbi:hypothetical protein RRG08_064834, partial [Elysia crispata]
MEPCTQGCDPGYRGRFCQSKCKSSTWGENCSLDCSTECVDRSCHHVTGMCTCWPGFWNLFCGEATVQLGAVLGGAVLVLTVCVIIGGTCVRRSVQYWVCVYQSWSSPCVSSLAVYVLRGQFSSGSVCISLGPHRLCHYWRCMCQEFLSSPSVSSLAAHVSRGQFSTGSVCISPGPHRLCHHWRHMSQEVSSVLGLCVPVLVLTVCVIIGGVCVRRYRRRRKAQPSRGVGDDISLCGAPHSERDYVRQGSSRTIAARALQIDSNNGQTPYSDPNQAKRNGKQSSQAKTSPEDEVPVETLKSYIRQHATDSHLKDEFSSIPMVTSSPQTAGLSPQNVKKNRYKNIIP